MYVSDGRRKNGAALSTVQLMNKLCICFVRSLRSAFCLCLICSTVLYSDERLCESFEQSPCQIFMTNISKSNTHIAFMQHACTDLSLWLFVSRTESQPLTRELMTCESNWCRRVLNMWFVPRWPYAVDRTIKSNNSSPPLPQWGAADAEIKVPSVENTEL